MSEVNKELLALKDELKESHNAGQVAEKRLLKLQDDHEMLKSKFETFKDIEIVRF